jgi:hypothetical protein
MAELASREDTHGAFEPKHLLDALPLGAEPVFEIRATVNLAMLQPSMPIVPNLSLFPAATIGSAILKQIRNILVERRLVILSNQHILACQSMDLRTQGALGMHGIQGEDASLDQWRDQQWFEGTDFILFLLHIAVPQDDASAHFVTTELMDRMGLQAGGSKSLAIDGQMCVIGLALRRLQMARFVSAPLLRFPSHEKRRQDLIKVLAIHSRQHVAIGHLAWHTLATRAELVCQSSKPDVESSPSLHSNLFVRPVSPRQADRGSAPIRNVCLVRAVHQTAVAGLGRAK